MSTLWLSSEEKEGYNCAKYTFLLTMLFSGKASVYVNLFIYDWPIIPTSYWFCKEEGAHEVTRVYRKGNVLMTVLASKAGWMSWRGLLKNYRLQKEVQRLIQALAWFLCCSVCMVLVQVNGDSIHAKQVRSPFLSANAHKGATAGLNAPSVYDLVIESLPVILDYRILNPDFMLHLFLIISLTFGMFFWTPIQLVGRVRRYFWLFGLGYLLRMLCLAWTVMPPSNSFCVPIERTFFQSLLMVPLLIFGSAHTCTDKIFSGHTTVATLLLLFWNEARNEVNDRQLSIWRIYPFVNFLAMITTSVLGKNHFTVDIVVAMIVNTLTYFLYMTLLDLAKIKRKSRSMALMIKSKSSWVVDLIAWCDGMDLIEDELISTHATELTDIVLTV